MVTGDRECEFVMHFSEFQSTFLGLNDSFLGKGRYLIKFDQRQWRMTNRNTSSVSQNFQLPFASPFLTALKDDFFKKLCSKPIYRQLFFTFEVHITLAF